MKNPLSNVPCCDEADGHQTTWKWEDGHFWVPIEGEMVMVPDNAVIKGKKNPMAVAIVWYYPGNDGTEKWFIRCFIRGDDT